MKHAVFLLLGLLSLAVTAEDKIDDQVVMIHEQDQAMNQAIQTARSQLDRFFEIAANPPAGAERFKLKVMVADENGVEHLWFSPFREIEGGYAGILVNQPGTIRTMEYGEIYAFRYDQITDWGYVLDGKQIGSFTVCAIFKTMDQATVDRYKQDHGFVCDS
ncbi:YegJ family protein [Endozoicomonadaceae bacterium StTr2]